MRAPFFRMILAAVLCALPLAAAQQPEVRTNFRVKYVAEGVVYLDAGRNAGLAEGQKLEVKRTEMKDTASGSGTMTATRIVARLVIASVADSSAVCEVTPVSGPVEVGDIAYLSAEDVQALLQQHAASSSQKYLQLISFSEGDPLDEEVRESVPRPPLPEINRARGRIGFEFSGFSGAGFSRQMGVVLRMDMTRIAGTYWNFGGYWRGRMYSRKSSAQPETLTDLLSRTYTLGFTYSSPKSRWVAGFGRLYVPWASSLNTLDGGYVGRKLGGHGTAGLFAGSTPDPTSWNYNPDRRIAGAFLNFEGGSFDAFRYNSTFGLGVSSIRWRIDRPFAFFENSFFYKHYVSIYQTLEADRPRVEGMTGQSTAGVSRSYVTLRLQVHPRVSLDLNHNYFRDFPTFDPRLVGTGLLDKLLFQGFSGGARVELPRGVAVYTNFGRSSQSGDARVSWNQLYGVTLADAPWAHVRADLRYSKFDSAFGRGSYQAISISREFFEGMRLDILGGTQHFDSPFTRQSNSRFVTTTLDWFLGPHYFVGAGFTWNRGAMQDYNQLFLNTGYRF